MAFGCFLKDQRRLQFTHTEHIWWPGCDHSQPSQHWLYNCLIYLYFSLCWFHTKVLFPRAAVNLESAWWFFFLKHQTWSQKALNQVPALSLICDLGNIIFLFRGAFSLPSIQYCLRQYYFQFRLIGLVYKWSLSLHFCMEKLVCMKKFFLGHKYPSNFGQLTCSYFLVFLWRHWGATTYKWQGLWKLLNT